MNAVHATYITPDGHGARFMSRRDAALALERPSTSADWIAWSNYASALYVAGRTDASLAAAQRAVARDRNPTTILNLGVIHETRGELGYSLALGAEAYSLDPHDPHVRCWYSDALLRAGDFSSAWPIYSGSHGDWSWVRHLIPEWDGRASLARQRLLILSAGGYGDSILYARWLPYLRGLGAHVTLMCPRTLQTLLGPLVDRTISGSIAGLDPSEALRPSDYDLFASSLSLGGYFCPMPSDIPPTPYLAAPADQVALRRYVLRGGATPLFGICTRAGEETFPRRHRSLSADQSARITSASTLLGADWVNLNYGESLPGTYHSPGIRDWVDTAAIITNLDLLVTVDTGVAHLGGALGIPTWVILPGISAAYYGLKGPMSPFYPSQRLFRNGREGIDAAVDASIHELGEWRPA